MEKSLFSIKLPECKTNEELNNLFKENPKLDQYYIASSTISDRRTLFEECYKLYEPYEDKNFLTEIETRFHQRTWEMYLGSLCLKNKKILKKDRKDNLADIQVINNSNLIHIECTAVTHGDPTNSNSVPPMRVSTDINNIFTYDVPEDRILLRIAQALNDKLNQYNERLLDGRVLKNEPYIIAVNTGEMGYPEHLPYILKAVFAIGYLTLRMRQNGKPIANPPSFWGRREIISKTNNQKIDMTFFEKDESKGISAVIYSNHMVLHHLTNPSYEIYLVHNPLATNPILYDEFSFLTQYYLDEKTGDIVKIAPKELE